MSYTASYPESVPSIIAEGFTPEGLHKLDYYAEQFISGRLVYQRFSPREQYGCSAGGEANVIASLLAGAENIPRSVRLIGDFVFGPGGGKIIIRDE